MVFCVKMLLSSRVLLILFSFIHLGATGRWVTLTTDSSAYQKANGLGVPITGRNQVILEVEVCKGAEIQILESESGAWTYYKLGGDNNEWSAMAASEDCDDNGCTWVDYRDIPAVDCNNFMPFWISWDAGGTHKIGTGDVVGNNVYMTGTVTYFDVNFFQVSNFDDGVTAEWKFLIDEPPMFTSPSALGNTVVDVNEDVGIGIIIYNVAGTDPEGDSLVFTLDTHTDVFEFAGTAMKTRQPLDYEDVAFYDVLISMSDGRNIQQAALTISVKDVIDETPVITLSGTLSIREEFIVGTIVSGLFTVIDNDRDDTLNYIITGTHSNLFNIDINTGVLTIAGRIDRDQAALTLVTLDLQVTDSNNLQATETISVTITDINDNDPVFTATTYTVNVEENTASDTSILDFIISDADEGTNAAFNVFIVDGDDAAAKFTVIGNQLRTGPNTLDYEFQTTYTLRVVAINTDNIRTGTTTVTVQVMSENEADPIFDSPGLDGLNKFPGQSLAEDAPINHVIPFAASDADLGADGDITFSIVSVIDSDGADASSSFTIDQTSGNLRLIRLLDSDTDTGGVDYHDVTIRITDGGSSPRSTDGTIRLTLTNVNDNAPQFASAYYTVSIAENAHVGDTVGSVGALDFDGDDVTYTVEGSWSSVFEMNATDVTTSSILDYATTPLYVITIRADDGQYQTDVLMTISVAEVVSATFQITAKPNVKIHEELGEETVIAGVFKTVGNTGAVTYSLEGQNANYLSVDSVSGVLSYGSQRINRDGVNGMTTLSDITLKGVDGAGDVATADLSFVVTDVNDNAPVATTMAATVEVHENSADNQFVMSFTLSDADEGSNSDVTLSISSGDVDNVFSIVNHDLYVNGGNVNYESLPADKKYHMILLAKDNPTTATVMTTAIQVTVEVLGENEFTPTWISPTIGADSTFPSVTVLESAPLGETVENFVATDDDDGDDGRVTYSVKDIKDPSGSQVTGKFMMTSDGRLVIASALDYDAETGGVAYYIVTVVATDSGSNVVKSTLGNIKIHLENVEFENQILVPQASTSESSSEMWVMRALVAVFGVAILALGSIMLKSIITSGTTSLSSSAAKVAPKNMVERPVSVTPHMSLTSVRINDENDHFSWIEREDAVASRPPGSTQPVGSTHPLDSTQPLEAIQPTGSSTAG